MILNDKVFKRKDAEFELYPKTIQIHETKIPQGISEFTELLVFRRDDYIKVYDRVCDHNGGKLITNNGKTICPLHGWAFDASSGKYLNAQCVKKPIFEGECKPLQEFDIEIKNSRRKLEDFQEIIDFDIRFLNHACIMVCLPGLKFAIDPWLSGSAFSNGWWLSSPSPADAYEQINTCDFIYISHNHPDHLNTNTLQHIDKNIPILTGKFSSGSTERFLKSLGFKTVYPIGFSEKWMASNTSFAISALKSGDFRDDTGLLLEIGNKTILLTVDCNFLDFWRFPKHIDLLWSSFAGGASGFPLCFDNYTEKEKDRIIARNKKAIYTTNKTVLRKIQPKMFIPYAGFFKEKAKRDKYITERNKKNNIQDYSDLCNFLGVKLIDLTRKPIIECVNENFVYKAYNGTYLDAEQPEDSIKKDDLEINLLDDEIIHYFKHSLFFDNLDFNLIPTDENFNSIGSQFFIKFSSDNLPIVQIGKVFERRIGSNFLECKVRIDELHKVIKRGLPWEDLLIGFQCRISREPNYYNANFWYHFTNNYVNDKVSRQMKDCSGCEVLSQSIY
jgi:CMP-N-acetylneuraminate monooxygenase